MPIRAALLLSLAVVLTPTATGTRPLCRLDNLLYCDSVNSLFYDARFKLALRSFLHGAPGGMWARGKLATAFDLVEEFMGGPPDERVREPDGLFVLGACRPHECDDKGVLVLAPDGKILAAALLIPGCYASATDTMCATRVLRLYVHDPAVARRLIPALRATAGTVARPDKEQVFVADGRGWQPLQVPAAGKGTAWPIWQ